SGPQRSQAELVRRRSRLRGPLAKIRAPAAAALRDDDRARLRGGLFRTGVDEDVNVFGDVLQLLARPRQPPRDRVLRVLAAAVDAPAHLLHAGRPQKGEDGLLQPLASLPRALDVYIHYNR